MFHVERLHLQSGRYFYIRGFSISHGLVGYSCRQTNLLWRTGAQFAWPPTSRFSETAPFPSPAAQLPGQNDIQIWINFVLSWNRFFASLALLNYGVSS